MGVSGYNIYNDYSQGGMDAVNGWDVADFGFGAASLGATIPTVNVRSELSAYTLIARAGRKTKKPLNIMFKGLN